MCENNSNLSSSAEIQGGKSLLGSVDLKFSPVYNKNGQPCSQGQGEVGAVSGKGFLGFCPFAWRYLRPPEVPLVTATALPKPLKDV